LVIAEDAGRGCSSAAGSPVRAGAQGVRIAPAAQAAVMAAPL
jgi:hypothetical protein